MQSEVQLSPDSSKSGSGRELTEMPPPSMLMGRCGGVDPRSVRTVDMLGAGPVLHTGS